MKHLAFAILFLIVTTAALSPLCAAAPDDILGAWLNQKQDAKIDIFKCGNNFCGKIIWLKEPGYPVGSKEGTPGAVKIDYKNPDTARQKTPLMGLQIMEGLQSSGDNRWKGGNIYDPDSGKTYSSKATLVSHDQLDLRGFIGVSLLGRTEKWTRAK
jgi:uncharacterized protein (DUF2147 family)